MATLGTRPDLTTRTGERQQRGNGGIALDLGASAPNTVLGFAILVGIGGVVSGWA